ncbi:helix-turn-helix domain-containing protein [Meiothermus ruber]|uniref:HTH iclR-type domain-containing protein n=1 Tax=Meiothermus ruber (strain ATCC 35948 / DSM 1279 / VKM B-1258 / 21) TaxID=504728 RepID=D3PTE7_MEIRD|nr:helix-turn-helix domain-containing protein [Meiothermus ruber]ADD28730.1 hypothetical protein Mrub_1974 [Meiothermus ruber DSM 1279]AGK05822.1 hypothetical protein K649_12680 [Meiothermus ruber DSM 1279]
MNPSLRNSLIGLLALAYLATLVMSAGHLTKWFDLSLGDLPAYFSIGLAVGLELLAFTLSLASTLEPRLRWSLAGGIFFLLLVWLGNLLAMARVAEAPGWEVLAQSLFALGPLVAGKAIGELLRLTPPLPSAAAKEPTPTIHLQTHVHTTQIQTAQAGMGMEQSVQWDDRMAQIQTAQAGMGMEQSVQWDDRMAQIQTAQAGMGMEQSVQWDDRMAQIQTAQAGMGMEQSVQWDDRMAQILDAVSSVPLRPSTLARLTGIPKTTVYRLTARLVEAGLVLETPDGLIRREAGHG